MSEKEINMVELALSLLEHLDEKNSNIGLGLGALCMALVMSSRQLGLPKEGVLDALHSTVNAIYDDPEWKETLQ